MTSPPPALFVNENVKAHENRLNLALFGLLNVSEFRSWFLERLGLPSDSIVYPPEDVSGIRPDFVAVQPDGGVRCWIEVELGGPDQPQLADYRTKLGGTVICIAGTGDCDLSLDEIREEVRRLQPAMDEQQRTSSQVLLGLIEQGAGKTGNWSYVKPDEGLRREPLIVALAARLPNRLIYRTPPVPQGKILVSTITQKAWTLRVYSHASKTDRSFAVMWNPAVGGGMVRVPSQDWLSQYLPKGEAAANYGVWLADAFDVDVSSLSGAQHAPVSELALLERVDELADLLEALSLAG